MDIADCIPAEEISMATLDDGHLGIQSEYVLCGLQSTEAEV